MDQLRQIARIGSDFVILHQRTGEVDDCSFSTTDFYGLHSDDLMVNGFMERVHIADRPACLDAFSRAFHGEEKVLVELRLQCLGVDRGPGPFHWIELMCSAVTTDLNEHPENRQVLSVARDITHWKEREKKLVLQEQEALEMIESKTRFLTAISHELRTPLNAVIGFSEMMKLPGITAQNERQMLEYAGIINDSGKDLLAVVDEVFELSQIAFGHYKTDPEVFSVATVISASAELLQCEAEEKGVRILIDDLDKSLMIRADRKACKQALVSLLAGLIKETQKGGRITLSVKSAEGVAEFSATRLAPRHDDELSCYRPGLQLQQYVDLLGGRLEERSSAKGQTEIGLQLPVEPLGGSRDAMIVPMNDMCDCAPSTLKKTA